MEPTPGSPITQPAIALSIVIPVYNKEQALSALFRELERVRAGAWRDAGPVEIVLVDDGSTDRSWARIATQCDRDPGVVGGKLSLQFGHQVAVAAALEAAGGKPSCRWMPICRIRRT